ncbi:-glutamine gamma-glutamyltransferase E [Pelobates cultripes]|uniref:protein-glutamine gamma-glutamyltransferase n=2 Tax=Pelobates cultripes TaxID=61616 RepID=A0AAD1SIM0_PELCU|nr:-glutamine gamma-glutamyltransferase E [Pelobates cultripes]
MATLRVTGSDLQISTNRVEHHTNSYQSKDLIVRRGYPFSANVTFNQSVTNEDQMQFYARLVTEDKGASLLENPFVNSSKTPINGWGVLREATVSNSVRLTFYTPSNAVIGRYSLELDINGERTNVGAFILLFNCWASDDIVYLSDEAQRQEYLLSEFGIIFMGEPSNPQHVPWDYGQFQDNILDICLSLMDSTINYRRNPSEDVRRRNDPSYLCRVLSAIVNDRDDGGVIQGNWSEDYSGGTDPKAWTGSARILRSWYPQKSPVKYGQCWVFAGVLCTVSRALGLPCRIITNFSSAHDTNNNLIIETYYKVTGEPSDRGGDSIWNFHCWNESWFRRSDLDAKYSGWQIWDSTPQEKSDGMFQLGPTSQFAIKEGDVDKKYDTSFLYAEVNADVLVFIEQNDGSITKGSTDTVSIGPLICTKAVGMNSMNNVTQEYKHREGTPEERQVYSKARSLTSGAVGFVALSSAGETATAPNSDPVVSGKIIINGTPTVGDDINATLFLKNLTLANKNVTANVNASAIVYNKRVRRTVFSDSVAVQLGPNEEKPVALQILYSQYENSLTTDKMIQVCSVCQVEGWGELYVEANITLQNPPMEIKALGPAVLGTPLQLEVTFTNPLSMPVADCVLTAEGSGVTHVIHKSIGVLEPAQTISVTIDTMPYMSGTKQLLIIFTADKFHMIKNFTTIEIAEG